MNGAMVAALVVVVAVVLVAALAVWRRARRLRSEAPADWYRREMRAGRPKQRARGLWASGATGFVGTDGPGWDGSGSDSGGFSSCGSGCGGGGCGGGGG
ncbi:hypothetical protein [Mycobacterium sp. C31M]